MFKDFCARVMPTYMRRRSSSILLGSMTPRSTLSRCGSMPSSTPIKKTWPNSKPLAACKVDNLTASTSPASWPSSMLIKETICVSSSRFLASASRPYSVLASPFLLNQPMKSMTLAHLLSAARGSSLSYKNASYCMVLSKSSSTSLAGSRTARCCNLLM